MSGRSRPTCTIPARRCCTPGSVPSGRRFRLQAMGARLFHARPPLPAGCGQLVPILACRHPRGSGCPGFPLSRAFAGMTKRAISTVCLAPLGGCSKMPSRSLRGSRGPTRQSPPTDLPSRGSPRPRCGLAMTSQRLFQQPAGRAVRRLPGSTGVMSPVGTSAIGNLLPLRCSWSPCA
jgi:hypothetical protein